MSSLRKATPAPKLWAETLGGYQRIDQALDAVWDALLRNPYALPRVQSDWYSARYQDHTLGGVPALLCTIEIQTNGDVVIAPVEEWEAY